MTFLWSTLAEGVRITYWTSQKHGVCLLAEKWRFSDEHLLKDCVFLVNVSRNMASLMIMNTNRGMMSLRLTFAERWRLSKEHKERGDVPSDERAQKADVSQMNMRRERATRWWTWTWRQLPPEWYYQEQSGGPCTSTCPHHSRTQTSSPAACQSPTFL